MPAKKTHIYLLPLYANKENLENNRYATEHESKVKFSENDVTLELSETNSLIEEKYCLSIMSAKYVLEGTVSQTEIKEAMIHHHPYGHPWKHLQFKLTHKNEVIRINLEPLDEDDYVKCIKGFLHISQDLLSIEQRENDIRSDLLEYFFDQTVNSLEPFRDYLLGKIKAAYDGRKMLNNSNEPINSSQLETLRADERLLPFLKW